MSKCKHLDKVICRVDDPTPLVCAYCLTITAQNFLWDIKNVLGNCTIKVSEAYNISKLFDRFFNTVHAFDKVIKEHFPDIKTKVKSVWEDREKYLV